MPRESWCIWDGATDRRAGLGSYMTQAQAEYQITVFKARQKAGGRPDIDPSEYYARVEDDITRAG